MKKLNEQQKQLFIKVLAGVLGIVLVFLIASVLFGGKDKKKPKDTNDNIKANTSENVIKDQEVDGLKFSNTSLIINNGQSKLTTEVKNIGDEDKELKSFNIIVKDKDGKEIMTLLGYVGEKIVAGEVRTIESSTDRDLSNAKSLEYQVNY